MKIAVFGAAGAVGRQVVEEALSRHHTVTAIGRNPSTLADLANTRTAPDPADRTDRADPSTAVRVRRGDASVADDVAVLSRGHDLVISATRPAPGYESELVAAAKGLVDGLAGTAVRLMIVGGAASLIIPGRGGTTVVDGPDFPADWLPIALACNDQLDVIRSASDVDWTYVSPPALLEPGDRTGEYRVGTDQLVVSPDGDSRISLADFAIALIDEAEHKRHPRARFTVGY